MLHNAHVSSHTSLATFSKYVKVLIIVKYYKLKVGVSNSPKNHFQNKACFEKLLFTRRKIQKTCVQCISSDTMLHGSGEFRFALKMLPALGVG